MKQFVKKPLSIALISAFSLNAHAALYEVIDLGASSSKEIHNYTVSGTSSNKTEGLNIGIASIEGQYFIDHDAVAAGIMNITSPISDEGKRLLADGEFTDADLQYYVEDSALPYKGTLFPIFSLEGNEWTRLRVWDEILDETGDYSGTTNEIVEGVNDHGIMVGYGSAPYKFHEWEDKEGNEFRSIYREFAQRAFAYNALTGELVAIQGAEPDYGSMSKAVAINNNGLVIGEAYDDVPEEAIEAVEACLDLELLPEVACNKEAFTNVKVIPHVWQLDSELETVETGTVGMLFEPDEFYTGQIQATLNAVNDNGYIVGSTLGYRTAEATSLGTYAAIYTQYSKDGDRGVIDITDRDIYLESTAIDINNNNIVVGNASRRILGPIRTKAFYYDMSEAGLPELKEIPSQFQSSSSTVKDINNRNQVVGTFEWEVINGTRRTHAYVYQVGASSFVDLNNSIPCDSNWEIVDVTSIRDDGLILATALGEMPILDDEGEPLFGQDGFQRTQLVARGVALKPVEGGVSETCPNAEVTFPEHERQGAGFGWLLLALPALLFRRKLC